MSNVAEMTSFGTLQSGQAARERSRTPTCLSRLDWLALATESFDFILFLVAGLRLSREAGRELQSLYRGRQQQGCQHSGQLKQVHGLATEEKLEKERHAQPNWP